MTTFIRCAVLLGALALAWLLRDGGIVSSGVVQAQDIGIVSPGDVMGNGVTSPSAPTDTPITSVIDKGACTTNGSVLFRQNGKWTCLGTPLVAANNFSDVTSPGQAMINLFPPATRAGDILYWNGSGWTHLAGNNSGTQFLQETAGGVPSWATASGSGTVTSIATGNGLSGGTITSTGTLTANVDGATIKDSGGPLVAQNTTVGGATCTPGGSCTPESISGVTASAAGSNLSNSVANYFWAFSSATEAVVEAFWPVTGHFTSFSVNLSAAPGTGKSYAFQLNVAGVATALTCTVSNSATSCGPISSSVAVTANQTVDISAGPSGTPTVSSPVVTLTFQTP